MYSLRSIHWYPSHLQYVKGSQITRGHVPPVEARDLGYDEARLDWERYWPWMTDTLVSLLLAVAACLKALAAEQQTGFPRHFLCVEVFSCGFGPRGLSAPPGSVAGFLSRATLLVL